MLKILQARLQQYINREFPDVQAGFRKGRVAQAPKLAPHMESIRASVAETLGVGLGCVNIKAKTNEGMDAVGRKEAIEVHAVALLESL